MTRQNVQVQRKTLRELARCPQRQILVLRSRLAPEQCIFNNWCRYCVHCWHSGNERHCGSWSDVLHDDTRREVHLTIGKSLARIVAHQSDRSDSHLSLGRDRRDNLSDFVMVVIGRAQSQLLLRSIHSQCIFIFQPITKFLIINPSGCSGSCLSSTCLCLLCDAQDAECGAAAFQKKLLFFTLIFSLTLCFVMLATSSSLSLTPSTYLPGGLQVFLLALALLSDLSLSLFCSLIV